MTHNRAGSAEIVKTTRCIAGVPTLICYQSRGQRPRPLVILSHGFGDSKAAFDTAIAQIARLGGVAVAIDNCGHGDRPGPDFVSQVFQDRKLDIRAVRRLIKETADDIPALIDHFETDPQVDTGRIGLVGVSMGGFVTFRSLVIEPRLTVGAPIIASPYWDDIPADVSALTDAAARARLAVYAAQYSPAQTKEAFSPRPLLIQIAADDDHYDVARVKAFYNDLKTHYRDAKERLRLICHPQVGHELTPAMWQHAVDWLAQHLLSGD